MLTFEEIATIGTRSFSFSAQRRILTCARFRFTRRRAPRPIFNGYRRNRNLTSS